MIVKSNRPSPTSPEIFILEAGEQYKKEIAALMAYRGLQFSTSASRAKLAVLFSTNPYAVCDISGAENVPTLAGYKKAVDSSRALDGKGTRRLPPGRELWPYQKATLDYLLERNGGIDADEPGLGKTPTAISFCNEVEARRILCIVPASVRLQWGERIAEWSTITDISISVMLKVKDGIHPTAHYQIISYEAARNPAIMRAISKTRWDVLICDEAHKMKNADALTTRAILGNREKIFDHGGEKVPAICTYCDRSLALTGTPLLNRPSECLTGWTLVLTNRGWVPIVKVKKTDLLWDGVEWVEHCGLLYQGSASTVNVGRISATATHRFLDKFSWVKAEEAVQNMGLLNLLLEKGSENLPSVAWGNFQAVRRLLNAIANVEIKPALQSNVCEWVRFFAAVRAGRKLDQTANIPRSAPILRYENAFSDLSSPPVIDVQTLKTLHGNPTEDAVSVFGRNGWRIVRLFWNILFHWKTAMFQAWNWTVSTTIEDMNLEICGSSAENTIKQINGVSMKFKEGSMWPWKKSKCLEHVFDLANAGPRQRFTVLSVNGPIISHNCYVLFRHFDWESIDYATEDGFKDRYNRQADLKTLEGKRFKLESTSLELELQNRLRVNIMARHEKIDVLKQLKLPRFQLVKVAQDKAIKGALDAEGMLGITIEEIQTTKDIVVLGHIAEARRLMGEAIAPQVIEYARDFLEGSSEKLVIFAWHLSVLRMINEGLANFNPVTIHGGTNPAAREAAKYKFINDPLCRVIAGNIQSMGEGVDGLQHVASRCFIAEPDWVPSKNDQAVARLWRIGQEGQVTAELFVAPGSVGEKILVSALKKLNVIHRTLDERQK